MGGYLFSRILKKGHDSRFDQVKHQPQRFFTFWMRQAVRVLLCSMPAIVVDAIHPAAFKAGLGVPNVLPSDVAGVSLFVAGFLLEAVADYQKSVWYDQKQKKLHDEQFITRGLWGRRCAAALLLLILFAPREFLANQFPDSRYPNYFGDILLWIGVATTAAGVLSRGPVQASFGWYGTSGQLKAVLLPAAAPAFVAWVLLRTTGVPLSQVKYDKLYGNRQDYQQWRNNTPLLIPKLF